MQRVGSWLECDNCYGTGASTCPACAFAKPDQVCGSCGGTGMIVCAVCKGSGGVFNLLFNTEGSERITTEEVHNTEGRKEHIQSLIDKMEQSFLLENKLYQKIIQEIPYIPRSRYVSKHPDKFMHDYRILFRKLTSIPEGEILISKMLDFTGYKIKLKDLQTGIVIRYRKSPPSQVSNSNAVKEFSFLGSRGFRDIETNIWIHEPIFIEKLPSASGHSWYKNENGSWRFFHNGKLSASSYSVVINFEQRYTWAREDKRNYWVYVDTENDTKIIEGTEVLEFDQEVTWVKNEHWSLYNLKTRKLIVQDRFIDGVCRIDKRTFWVSKFDHKFLWGIVDITGKWVLSPQVKEFKEASHGIIPAKKDYWGYINTHGHWLVQPKLREASPFDKNGKAQIAFFFSKEHYTITLKDLTDLNNMIKRNLNPKGVKAWWFRKTH